MLLAALPLLADSTPVVITLKNNSPAEQKTKAQLERLLSTYKLEKWLFTKTIVIDENTHPSHSHPVLTLEAGDSTDPEQLSGFVHEQLHWFLDAHKESTDAAVAELKRVFPNAPTNLPEGARGNTPPTCTW